MALVKIGDVGQNFLTLVVIFLTFLLIYKSMKEGKAKNAIKGLFEKVKEEKKHGK